MRTVLLCGVQTAAWLLRGFQPIEVALQATAGPIAQFQELAAAPTATGFAWPILEVAHFQRNADLPEFRKVEIAGTENLVAQEID